jgi:hypothetical protein
MRDIFSAISAITYFSANERVEAPGFPFNSRFWVDWVFGRTPEVPMQFRTKLRDEWIRHVSKGVDGPVLELYGPANPATLSRIQFPKG